MRAPAWQNLNTLDRYLQTAFPRLPPKRTCRRHAKIDANDPKADLRHSQNQKAPASSGAFDLSGDWKSVFGDDRLCPVKLEVQCSGSRLHVRGTEVAESATDCDSATVDQIVDVAGVELVTSVEPEAVKKSLAQVMHKHDAGNLPNVRRDLTSIDYETVFLPLFERIEK